MQIKSYLTAGEVWTINHSGSAFAVIRAQEGLYVKMYDDNGAPVLDSELSQGVNLRHIEYAYMTLHANQDMAVEVWVGKQQYDFVPQPNRASSIKSHIVPLRAGVNRLLEQDAKRQRAVIQPPVDMYIGGSDMRSEGGQVHFGRKFDAGAEIELSNYGNIYYWVTDDATFPLYAPEVAPRTQYVQGLSRTQFEANNVPYFDIDVPQSLHNVNFKLYANISHKTKNTDGFDNYPPSITMSPNIYYTAGDPTTDALTRMGIYGGSGVWDGSIAKQEIILNLTAGVHRVFWGEVAFSGLAGHVMWGESFTTFHKIWTVDTALNIRGYAQIMEERT